MYLLATGERGLGYQAVFGDQPLNWREFEEFSFYQQRVMQASTDEGRNDIDLAYVSRHLDEMDAKADEIEARRATEVFDPERMTSQEVEAWMARYAID